MGRGYSAPARLHDWVEATVLEAETLHHGGRRTQVQRAQRRGVGLQQVRGGSATGAIEISNLF